VLANLQRGAVIHLMTELMLRPTMPHSLIGDPSGDRMRRREFIGSLIGTAVAWSLTVRAQQPAKLQTIGFLGATTASTASQWVAAFVQRLRELGRIGGHNVAIEVRWAEGRRERYTEIAAEFI
jgi:putative tryptophan/tyrosine transport system substrate-binding protein